MSSSRASRARRFAQNFALVIGSTLVGLVLFEAAYRVKLAMNPFKPLDPGVESFTASGTIYGLYDRDFGVRYEPGSSHHVITVTVDGRVIWVPDNPVSVCNADGFQGRATLDDYGRAKLKIIVFGDSFSHWNQNGVIWPDLLEDRLDAAGRDASVLSAARGGYGVIQMFDLAAYLVPEHRPDIAIIAFISDDISRARWWTRAVERAGYRRPLLSTSPDNFGLEVAVDEYIAHPQISPEWAKETMRDPQKGPPLIGEVIAQYRAIQADFYKARGLQPIERSYFSVRESYLLNRILTGDPVVEDVAAIPRVTFDDFREDARFLDDVRRLRESGTEVILVHLPIMFEVAEKRPSWDQKTQLGPTRRMRLLAASLEEITGLKIQLLEQETAGVKIPEKIDLTPENGHPNFEGLYFYAELVERVLAKNSAKFREGK